MRRLAYISVLAALALSIAAPAFAARARVVRRGGRGRAVVVVHRGFPLHRRLPVVVVRPARVAVRVAPRLFLAPVVWTAAVVAVETTPAKPVWEDSESLSKSDDWTEFALEANERGSKLFLQIDGEVQIDFAEVVFENGDTQVIDFETKTHGSGLYSLLDFKDGRKVDHVRVVARAESDEAKVVLRLS